MDLEEFKELKGRSVFLTIWHCKLSAELTKTHSFRLLFFGDFAHWVKTLHLKNSLLIDGIDGELMYTNQNI